MCVCVGVGGCEGRGGGGGEGMKRSRRSYTISYSKKKVTSFVHLNMDLYLKHSFSVWHRSQRMQQIFCFAQSLQGTLIWRSQKTGHMAVTVGKTFCCFVQVKAKKKKKKKKKKHPVTYISQKNDLAPTTS